MTATELIKGYKNQIGTDIKNIALTNDTEIPVLVSLIKRSSSTMKAIDI